jgi:hypothetical protein
VFCPFCGDQIAGDECAKPDCRQRLATATTAVAVASPPPPPAPSGATLVTPARAPVLAAPPAPITVAPAPPARVVRASVEQVLTERGQLWADMDSTAALVTQIESAAGGVSGTPASSIAAHPRLTAGADLIAELRAVENAVAAEAQKIKVLEGNINANKAEIARLNRNRILMITAIVAGVLLVAILLATAL